MRSWKILFIIVWKMAGLLVIPKNITNSSNNLQLVQKMVFYLSPGLIQDIVEALVDIKLGKVFGSIVIGIK